MDPSSQARLEQILNPVPMSAEPHPVASSGLVEMESIVQPRYPAGIYAGPERRAQGYLIAEVVVESPALEGRSPDQDRHR